MRKIKVRFDPKTIAVSGIKGVKRKINIVNERLGE